MSFSPTEIVDKYLLDQALRNQTNPRKTAVPHVYWPSDASIRVTNEYGEREIIGSCFRQQWYQRKNVPITDLPSATGVRIMEAGKNIEVQERNFTGDAGILVAHSVKFQRKIRHIIISGELDWNVRDKDGNIIGVECKTGSGYLFERGVFGTKTIAGFPRINNLLQAVIYLDYFMEKEGMEKIIILYISRGNFERKEHHVTFKEVTINALDEERKTKMPVINGLEFNLFTTSDIYERYFQLDIAMEQETLPERDYDPHFSDEKIMSHYQAGRISKSAYTQHIKKGEVIADNQCKYCNWRKRCLRDG